MKKLKLLLLISILTFAARVSAQIDTVFWLGAPWVTVGHSGNVPVKIHLSSFDDPTTVRILQPALGYDTSFTMAANSLRTVDLSHRVGLLEAKPANTVLNYGLKVETSHNVTAVYEVSSSINNPETYSLKGQNGLGTEFVTPFQTRWENNPSFSPAPKQMFTITATQDNTTVWITPRCNVMGGHPAGVTYSVVLNKGQVYTVENATLSTSVPGNNLSGSIVTSDKPVSVLVSDDSVRNVPGGGCSDLMGDQIVPVDVVGKEYIVNKGSMNVNATEGIFIVATENFTTVTINNGLTTQSQMLNKGDTWNYTITTDLSYVVADENVYLLQASGFGCELGAALLPPINCAGSDRVNFTRTNNQGFFLNILIPTSGIANFTLNGTPIPTSEFSPVPGTGGLWSGAQIEYSTAQIPVNSNNTIRNSTDFFALGVINGGSTSGCYYHYMSSFIRKTNVFAGNDNTLCDGALAIPVAGTVNGATTTGQWTVLNGSGTFTNPTSLSTTYNPTPNDYSQGTISFVLSSTGSCMPARDTVKLDFIKAPVVTAGTDQLFCANNISTINIQGGVQFATTAIWSSATGGAFGNMNNLTTTYTPSIQEIAQDSAILVLTSAGSFNACPNANDTLIIRFTPAPVVDAGPDLTICSNQTEIDLQGLVSGITTTGTWTTNGAGAFSPSQDLLNASYILSTSDVEDGQVTLFLTSTNNDNCNPVLSSFTLTIVEQPIVSITSPDSICATADLVNLSGSISNGFGAQWSTSGFGNLINPNSLNAIYNISSVDVTNGFVDVILSASGICQTVRDSVRINFIAAPVVDAGIDRTLCANELIFLNGMISGAAPMGQWQSMGTGTFQEATILTTTYIPSQGDIANGFVDLILSSTNNYGCIVPDDMVRYTFNAIPNANFNVNEVCEGINAVYVDQSTMNPGTIIAWDWNFGDGVISVTDQPLHAYTVGGTYNVQLIVTADNGCRDTIVKPLNIRFNPFANFEFTTACEDNPVQFTDISNLSEGNITNWTYNFNEFDFSNLQNPSYAFAIPGTFPVTLTVVSEYGCVSTVTRNVTVIASPVANFTINPNPAVVDETITFADQSQGTNLQSWLWDYADGQVGNGSTAYHSYNVGGVYEVMLTVTDANGCFDQIKIPVSVELLPVLPTGFSPNGDGENDVFIIRGGPFKSVYFKVYSHWGEDIFETNDGTKGWDGTWKGEPAPLGVYSWYFTVEMGNGTIVKRSGDVTLIR